MKTLLCAAVGTVSYQHLLRVANLQSCRRTTALYRNYLYYTYVCSLSTKTEDADL
jgi:hypothetical protein